MMKWPLKAFLSRVSLYAFSRLGYFSNRIYAFCVCLMVQFSSNVYSRYLLLASSSLRVSPFAKISGLHFSFFAYASSIPFHRSYTRRCYMASITNFTTWNRSITLLLLGKLHAISDAILRHIHGYFCYRKSFFQWNFVQYFLYCLGLSANDDCYNRLFITYSCTFVGYDGVQLPFGKAYFIYA